MTAHPAKFSEPILPVLARYLEPGWTVIDRFAGVGGIHRLRELVDVRTLGVELEPEWAYEHVDTWCDDAMNVRGEDRWDAEVTSVTYGNRFADKHNPQERCRACNGTGRIGFPVGDVVVGEAMDVRHVTCQRCKGVGKNTYVRRGYTHSLGRQLTPGNSGAMQWGPKYQDFHRAWLESSYRIVRRRLILNVSDHMRQKQRVPVVRWFLDQAIDVGFEWVAAEAVSTQRLGHGANRNARVPHEMVLVFDTMKEAA